MSHPIYLSALEEQARKIEQMCCASLPYLREFRKLQPVYEQSVISEYDIEESRYFNWLEYSISNNLIEICTKLRVFQDSYKYDWDPSYSPEVEAFTYYPDIIEVVEGDMKISFRECCNKVIHALSFELINETSDDSIKFWNGNLLLSGKQNRKKWTIRINILQFSLSIRLYLRLFT